MENRIMSLQEYSHGMGANPVNVNVAEEVLDALVELVGSEEEIEAAISAVATRTSAILANIQQAIPQNRVRGGPPTGYPPSGPAENMTEQQTYTAADIASMSNEEYAKVRDRLLASARPSRGR